MDGHSQYDISLIAFKILYQYFLSAVCADSFQNLCRAHCFYIFNLPPVSALYYSRKKYKIWRSKAALWKIFSLHGRIFFVQQSISNDMDQKF